MKPLLEKYGCVMPNAWGGDYLHGYTDVRTENGSIQGHNMALTGLRVPRSLESGHREAASREIRSVSVLPPMGPLTATERRAADFVFRQPTRVRRVDAYLCGHDHTLQHLESNGVQYYVSGLGSPTP